MIANGVLETPRLLVRPFRVADVARLVALFADPAVAQFVGDGQPLSEEDASLWVSRSTENLARHGYGTGAVIRRKDHAMIGWAGFARPQEGPEQVIYGLDAAHWRQGYGKEILKALIDFADERGHASVWATVDPANTASIRLLDQEGFVLVERGHQGDPDSDLYQRRAALGS
jgi:RimJ/RimL family protein N-acetyltransferase